MLEVAEIYLWYSMHYFSSYNGKYLNYDESISLKGTILEPEVTGEWHGVRARVFIVGTTIQ